jgi:hypothetical protein
VVEQVVLDDPVAVAVAQQLALSVGDVELVAAVVLGGFLLGYVPITC